MASELLPLPLGPQKTLSECRGISTSIPCRLCCAAPRTTMEGVGGWRSGFRRFPFAPGAEAKRATPGAGIVLIAFFFDRVVRPFPGAESTWPASAPAGLRPPLAGIRTRASACPVYDEGQAATC